jgi:hypothetical protein
MIDFITAALPWVIMGLTVAFLFTGFHRKKKSAEPEPAVPASDENAADPAEKEKKQDAESRVAVCMSVGMCLGVAIGTALSSTFDNALSYGICFGMLAGALFGQYAPKK